MRKRVGNNGHQLAEVLHGLDMLKNGQTLDQVAEIAKRENLMINETHLLNDDFWEDFCCRCEELNYTLTF